MVSAFEISDPQPPCSSCGDTFTVHTIGATFPGKDHALVRYAVSPPAVESLTTPSPSSSRTPSAPIACLWFASAAMRSRSGPRSRRAYQVQPGFLTAFVISTGLVHVTPSSVLFDTHTVRLPVPVAATIFASESLR